MDIQAIYERTIRQGLKLSTDSRTAGSGTFYVGLKGERFDGNMFAKNALDQGAQYAIIDNPEYGISDQYIVVVDTETFLQDLARHHREQFSIPILAIGGSNGKTTTKELIATVLAIQYRVHVTVGNLNNEIGTPLTVLAMKPDTEIGVIEIGANHPGEHAMLMNIVQPTHVLVTNNGADHLEGFGSLAGVRVANKEIYDWVATNGGTAFVNKSLPDLVKDSAMLDRILYPTADYRSTSTAYASVDYAGISITTQLFGSMNEANILAALAVGEYFKIPLETMKTAITSYVPTLKRSQIIQKGNTMIVMDCYNANPSSMKLALQDFFVLPGDRQKIIIVGDMLELGVVESEAHREILLLITKEKNNSDVVICVGPVFRCFQNQFPFHFFMTSDTARKYFSALDISNSSIFVKGSRGIKLEDILK